MTLKTSEALITERSLQFQGPLDSENANHLLQTANELIQKNNDLYSKFEARDLFSSFVELVQNISEYNEIERGQDIPSSLVLLEIQNNTAKIKTINKIRAFDYESIQSSFTELFELDEDALQLRYKNALLQGNSLGLLMLRKLKQSQFQWKLETSKEQKHYLHLELTINYGAITN